MILFPQDLQVWLDEKRLVKIIDIRPNEQRKIKPVIGLEAVVVLEEKIGAHLTEQIPAVLICQFGLKTEQIIRENGFRNLYSLLGGVQAWNAFKTKQQDLSRYSRQMVLPEIGIEGQTKLLASKVAIVGLGGLGCPVTQYLAAAGIGHLRLIDGDVVETSNIQRQPLYHDNEVGQPKPVVLARRLKSLNPDVSFQIENEFITGENIPRLLKRIDVVVDATDTLSARRIIDDFTRLNGIPFIYGGLYRYEGQIAVLNHRHGPCYRDLFPEHVNSGETCAEGGTLGMLPGIIGNIQALEAIKILLNIKPNLSGKLLLYDGLTHTTEIIHI